MVQRAYFLPYTNEKRFLVPQRNIHTNEFNSLQINRSIKSMAQNTWNLPYTSEKRIAVSGEITHKALSVWHQFFCKISQNNNKNRLLVGYYMKNSSSPPNTIRLNKIKHFVNFSESGDIFAPPAAYIMKASFKKFRAGVSFSDNFVWQYIEGELKISYVF